MKTWRITLGNRFREVVMLDWYGPQPVERDLISFLKTQYPGAVRIELCPEDGTFFELVWEK